MTLLLDFGNCETYGIWGMKPHRNRGVHSSRTMMYDDLCKAMTLPVDATLADYRTAIKDDNYLDKHSDNARLVTYQRLRELYGLDDGQVLFRTFRWLWAMDDAPRQQLALLTVLARDPLLRATANTVYKTPVGNLLNKDLLYADVRFFMQGRENERSSGNTTRNIASTWLQAGWLEGRKRKERVRNKPTPDSFAYACLIAYACGARDMDLPRSPWVAVLDFAMDGDEIAMAHKAHDWGFVQFDAGERTLDPTWMLDDESQEMLAAA